MSKQITNRSDLADAVDLLTQQVIVLRQVVDELVTEFQWRNQNSSSPIVPYHRRIESSSVDPTQRDFEVNSVPRETIDRLRASWISRARSLIRRNRENSSAKEVVCSY